MLISAAAVSVGAALLRFYFAGRVLVLSWPIDSCVSSQLICFQCVDYWEKAEFLHLLSGSGNHPLASAAKALEVLSCHSEVAAFQRQLNNFCLATSCW